jgi:hypothetical protein
LKVGIVSDLHCNARGLAQALDVMGDVDELICLGDSIWEYRFSNEIVRMLKERGAHTILGNHEEGFFGPQGARARAAAWIDPSLLAWLAERPHRLGLRLGGKSSLPSTRHRGSRAVPMSTRTMLGWRGSARATPILSSTATPITSW